MFEEKGAGIQIVLSSEIRGKKMKIKKVLLLACAVCALMPLAGSAVTVECLWEESPVFGSGESALWDYTYKLVFEEGDAVNLFEVGVGSGATISNIGAVDVNGNSFPALSYLAAMIPGTEDTGTLVDDGIVSDKGGTTSTIVRWITLEDFAVGTYYLGFTSSDEAGVFGWNADDALAEDWDVAVGNADLGPVHAPIPEPATLSMLLVASGLIGLIRKFRRTSY